MNKPVLLVMAAGLGSRYGGSTLKQIDPVGPNGEFIIDYSIYDAAKAGFSQVIFIIKPEMEQVFRSTIGARAEKSAVQCDRPASTADLISQDPVFGEQGIPQSEESVRDLRRQYPCRLLSE